ncbi:MAG TPA: hypothetical protein VKT49_14315 [Bryobacteraceae bacterium]|nr:hypothetical protein [Bryobacteraceae bacterium]
MPRRALFTLLLLVGFAWTLPAQTFSGNGPDGTVGVPYSWDYFPEFAQFQQAIASIPPTAGVSFTWSFTASGLPPGLAFSNGVIGGTPTTAGTFAVAVTWSFAISVQGYSQSYTVPFPPAQIKITGYAGPALSVGPTALNFTLGSGSTASATESISLSNHGQQSQAYSASASTSSGGNWLSISSTGGTVPFGSASISVTVNPSGLQAGTYLGDVNVSYGTSSTDVAVVCTISGGQKALQLSQTGLRFPVVGGGPSPQPQTVQVYNSGAGVINFGATASTTSGGKWLSVSPASGNTSGAVTVSVDTTGLQGGNDYYGQVQISGVGADNSPQTVSIVVDDAPAGTYLGAQVLPTGLIFVGQAGGSNPAVQSVQVSNPGTGALSLSAVPSYLQGSNWLTVTPTSASVSGAKPTTLQLQPNVTGLAAGVYVADVLLGFSDSSAPPHTSVNHIAVALVLTPNATGSAVNDTSPDAGICTPTKLVPVFTQLGSGFATVAAWPTAIEANVVDDCGNFMTSGSVIASFSSGDPSLSLLSQKNGKWSATWQPRSTTASQVTVTVQANQTSPAIQGSASIGGSLQTNPTTPTVNDGGVVVTAGYPKNQPAGLGTYISIFGSNLAAGTNLAQTVPFPTQLGSTQVLLGGELLPLQVVSTGQINAVVPYDLTANTTQQLIVQNGPAISVPVPVVISPVQPAVFASCGPSGTAPCIVGNDQATLVDTGHPLHAKDVAVIYCAGLGSVTPAVTAGSAASGLTHTVTPVTVTVGGQQAQILFAGLSAYVGLYQIDITVPSGVTTGNSVPLVITQGNLSSTPVNVAVQ